MIKFEAPAPRQTRVTIRTTGSQIFNGRVFHGHAMGFIPKAVPVAPARSEEYKLLVYVGHLLGTELRPLESLRPR